MRQAVVWIIFVVIAMIGGALLAPWPYWAMQHLAEHWPALSKIAQEPFHRYINRCMLAIALLGLYPLVRALGLKHLRDIGLIKPHGHWHELRNGFIYGVGSLAVLGLFLMIVGARGPDVRHPWPQEILRIIRILMTALGVGCVEELLFRGALFGTLRMGMAWKKALVISSIVYALLHFLQKPEQPSLITWSTGLQVLGQMLPGLWSLQRLGAELACLMFVGLLLGLCYQRTNTLYFSIGLHAGWIFWTRTLNLLTAPQASDYRWLWGTGRLYDGWMTTIVLGAMLIWLTTSRRWSKPPPGAQANLR